MQLIYAGVNPAQADEAYSAICDVIKDVKQNGITEDEFNRSREQMKSGMYFSNENSSSQMLLYGKYYLFFDEIFDFEKKFDRICNMPFADTKKAIDIMFNEKQKALSIVGNTDKPLPL